VGVLDQTTNAYVPPYDAVEAAWNDDAAFFSALDDRLPADARIVQVPYEPFPEPAATPFGIYEPAKAYLHSDDLRWSWGAMRGRPEDWGATIAGKSAADVVAAAREEGFTGILLDRVALGAAAQATETDFGRVLGNPAQPPDDRYVFFRF
jgi:phosphoglycerol transferase